jgi:4-amino-4-deoxy-L-arabinose transferase-like glycosyltransferase
MTGGWRRGLGLAVPLTVGVLLRAAWVLSGDFEPVSEAIYYHQHAAELAAGQGYLHPDTGNPTAFLPPAYPALLAPFYCLLGPSTHIAGLVNAGLAGVAIAGVYTLGRKLWGRQAGVVAAWLLALFPSQVLYASAVQADHLFAALVPWVMVAALPHPPAFSPQDVQRSRFRFMGGVLGDRRNRSLTRAALMAWRGGAGVKAGILVGLAALTAGPGLLLLPAATACWGARLPWRTAVRNAGLAAAATVVVLAPWTVRNYVQLGAFVPVSTNGGVNLWIGNNGHAGHGWMPWADSHWSYPEDEVAADRQFRAEGVRYLLTEPLESVSRWPGKLQHTFMQDYNYVEHFSLGPRVQEMPPGMNGRLLDWLAHRYYVAVLLLAAGSALSATTRRAAAPLAPFAIALIAPTVLFFGLDRFHVVLLPLAVAAAGAAAVAVAGQARAPRPAGQARAPRPAGQARAPRPAGRETPAGRWQYSAEPLPEQD